MSENDYIEIVTQALDIQVNLSYGKWKAIAKKLPGGSPKGFDLYSKRDALIDLLARIMCSTYRQKASQLIDLYQGKDPNKLQVSWNYQFLPDEMCKVIVSDEEGKEDSKIMRMIPMEDNE